MRLLRRLVGAAAVLGLLATAAPSQARGPDDALSSAKQVIELQRGAVQNIRSSMQQSIPPQRTAAQHLADGDLLLRMKDYDRAIIVFSQIVEKYPNQPSIHAEALYRLGESYYQVTQLQAAKRTFTRIVDEGTSGPLASYRSRAYARLTDIALKTKDLNSIDELARRMGTAASADPLAAYARGRVLLAKDDLSGAKSSFLSVGTTSSFHHQAKYLVGVVALKQARASLESLPEKEKADPRTRRQSFQPALDSFRAVTALPADTDEHKHVIDVAWLAVGRLLHEMDQWTEAVQAYQRVGRESPEFGSALFELASVYVRVGDAYRAQRALEILAIVEPAGAQAAEASLLRGDLELRSGQFQKALATFEGVQGLFEPMHNRVDAFLLSTSDPAVYFDKLVDDQLAGAEVEGTLPAMAIRWAREAENGPEAFAVVDEVVETRKLLRQSNELAAKLNTLMHSSGRAKAFPELRVGQQTALGAINALMRARVTLAQALDDEESSNLTGEVDTVRRERRTLQKEISELPVSTADFQQRENLATTRWNRTGQQLQQLQLQVDILQSVTNALKRVLRESASQEVVRDPATAQRFHDELAANENDLVVYRKQIETLRQLTDQGRVASGFDDSSVFNDESIRERYKKLLAQEVDLASRGAAGKSAASFANRMAPLLRSADEEEAKILAALEDINRQVNSKTEELLQTITTERAKLSDYAAHLELLDQEARLAVGEVAFRNFGLVRDRLRTIVVRADVGITEEAWESREVQQIRVRSLQSERARSERLLQEELQEVLDDAVDQ